MKIAISTTLKVIRSYKEGIGGNYMDLQAAIRYDAEKAIRGDRSFSFYLIKAREAGNPLTDEEKAIATSTYRHSVNSAMQAIFDKIYKVLPTGLRECNMYKEDMRWYGGW